MDDQDLVPVDRRKPHDVMDAIIMRKDPLDLVLAMIPTHFGTSEKATYLGFRAVGLDHRAALECLDKKHRHYLKWLEETPEMESYVNEHLPKLQAVIGTEIIRLGFRRNHAFFMFLDTKVLRKAHQGLDELTEREEKYLRTARRHYTPKQMLDLETALEPEKHRGNTIVLSFGPQQEYKLVEGEYEERGPVLEQGLIPSRVVGEE